MGNIQKVHTVQYDFMFNLFLICQLMLSLVLADTDLWPLERPNGMPNIIALEVMCGKDHMDVHLTFSHPFEGIVSSKGQHSDPHCVYIPPATSKTFFSFRISYSRCGTKPDLNGHFYENTVVVQYDKDLLEVWDEAKRLRCEWFNDYEKTASKPPMVIADLDVVQLDFRGDNVDCWMEIQHGKGPWAPPVNGIVPLGSTLTLVVAINDYRGEFDMRVKSCIASDGSGHVINLSDEQGCVLRPKMISRFLKARAPDDRSTAITYAFFHAFKFPDALSVHIKCKVEICRHGCLDHCQLNENINDRKDDIINDKMDNQNKMVSDISKDDLGEGRISAMTAFGSAEYHKKSTTGQTNDIRKANHENLLNQFNSLHEKDDNLPPRPVHEDLEEADMEDIFRNLELGDFDGAQYLELRKSNKFPYGPRQMAQKRMGIPIAGPRSLNAKTKHEPLTQAFSLQSGPFKDKAGDTNENTNKSHKSSTQRRRRSIIITDRKVRSTDVGVSSIYDVISEADLAFSLDVKQEAVTIFQGKISEEVVYGICLPVQGFSMLFIVVVSFTIVAALVAGSMLYRYQLQKEAIKKQVPVRGTLASWMTLRLFRLPETQYNTQNTQKSTTLTTLQNSLAGLTIPASLSEESVLK